MRELNNASTKNNENEKSEESLYKLNVRDSTPENIKENVIIPSNKYNNLFQVKNKILSDLESMD